MTEKTCQLTGKTFQITALETELCAAFDIPLSVITPEERFRRLASFRSEKQLFLRTCDATGYKLFSAFPPGTPFPVYAREYWRSPKWDPLSYGQPFDFKRLFVEQLLELWRKVPRPAAIVDGGMRPGKIVHRVEDCERGFLLFDSRRATDSLYASGLEDCARCMDSYQLRNCNSCFELVLSEGCDRVRFGEWCFGCRESWFLANCTDCENCLFCVGLTGKRFHIFNEPVAEDEYHKTLASLSLDARPLLDDARNKFAEFYSSQTIPGICAHPFGGSATELSGNYLIDCRDAQHCFECSEGTRIVNCHGAIGATDCFDSVSLWDGERIAQSVSIRRSKNLLNCVECKGLIDSAYCGYCEDSSNLFACVGLREKEYCIFNTQFSKSEYEELRTRIVKHLKDRHIFGTPLQLSFAEVAYNHSMASEQMPLTKIPAKMMGFNWDETDRVLRPSELLGDSESAPEELYGELPESLRDTPDEEVCSQVFICSLTGKPFQLIREEVALLRELGLPPPAVCFQQRHIERLSRITPHSLTERSCSVCAQPMRSSVPVKWKQPVTHPKCMPADSTR